MESDREVAILGPFGRQNFETEHVWLFNSKVVDFQLALVGIQTGVWGFPFREPDNPGVLVLVGGLGSGLWLGFVDLDRGDRGGTGRSGGVGRGGLLTAYLVPYISCVRCVLSVQSLLSVVCPVQRLVGNGKVREGEFFWTWGKTQGTGRVQVLVVLGRGLGSGLVTDGGWGHGVLEEQGWGWGWGNKGLSREVGFKDLLLFRKASGGFVGFWMQNWRVKD